MRRLAALAMSAFAQSVLAATPAAPLQLPLERDCTRWEAPRTSTFDRADDRGQAATGAFADRMPNLDPTLQPALRRPTSAELLLCEQLNVKDKLDWLIRRLAR